MTATMGAVQLDTFGPPDLLTHVVTPIPECADDEVLIRVAYCGVCRHDLLTRRGAFPNSTLPIILGHQVSGWIEQAGSDTSLEPGQPVMTMIYTGCGQCHNCLQGNDARCLNQRPLFLGEDINGGYAEFVAVKGRIVIALPPTVALRDAAILTCTLGTAYHALTDRGGVGADQHVLITGASGGVGLHAIQVAKLFGARVTAVVSTEERGCLVSSAGADAVVVAPDRTFAKVVKRGEFGAADLVLEVVGANTLNESLHVVRDGGIVVVVGNVEGAMATIPPAYLILKELNVVGTKSCSAREMATVLGHLAAGDLRADVTDVVPLREVRAVHERMEQGDNVGRIVLEVA